MSGFNRPGSAERKQNSLKINETLKNYSTIKQPRARNINFELVFPCNATGSFFHFHFRLIRSGHKIALNVKLNVLIGSFKWRYLFIPMLFNGRSTMRWINYQTELNHSIQWNIKQNCARIFFPFSSASICVGGGSDEANKQLKWHRNRFKNRLAMESFPITVGCFWAGKKGKQIKFHDRSFQFWNGWRFG